MGFEKVVTWLHSAKPKNWRLYARVMGIANGLYGWDIGQEKRSVFGGGMGLSRG